MAKLKYDLSHLKETFVACYGLITKWIFAHKIIVGSFLRAVLSLSNYTIRAYSLSQVWNIALINIIPIILINKLQIKITKDKKYKFYLFSIIFLKQF